MAGMDKNSCLDCQDSSTRFSMNFNVREKPLDMARIAEVPEEFL